ncbi:hypothetical protein Btru_063750 [Bulinus truncatus]|nr:hypothetical protein Btru_063750 [Bulinus truncatus]
MMSVNKTVVIATMGAYDPAVLNVFLVFNGLVCAEVIGLLGIMGNVINIINFRRQGLGDSVTITLTALSLSDCGALLCQQVVNILSNPWIPKMGLPFVTSSCALQTHGYFIRVSGLVTAFASLERCLCVVTPLKVRSIVTARVSVVVNAAIFVVLQLYHLPQLWANYVDWRFIPQLNVTILSLYYRENGEAILQVSYYATDLFVPYLTFIIIVSCTTVTVVQLKAKAKWRNSVSKTGGAKTPSEAAAAASFKERRVVLMLAVISIIFVVCLTPQSALLTAVGVVRELKTGGAKFDISMLCYCFTLLLETIHCSINIVVYYKMSSRFISHLMPDQGTLAGDTKDTLTGDTKDTVTCDTKGTLTGGTKDTRTGGTKDTLTGDTKDTLTGDTKDTVTCDTKGTLTGGTKDTRTGGTKDTLTGGTKDTLTGGTKGKQVILKAHLQVILKARLQGILKTHRWYERHTYSWY